MENCCICGKKISKFEDKLTIGKGQESCYRCSPIIRGIKNAESEQIFIAKKKELGERMQVNDISDTTRAIIESMISEAASERDYNHPDQKTTEKINMNTTQPPNILQEVTDIKKDINTIKNIALFFCAVSIISLICMFALTSSVYEAVRGFTHIF